MRGYASAGRGAKLALKHLHAGSLSTAFVTPSDLFLGPKRKYLTFIRENISQLKSSPLRKICPASIELAKAIDDPQVLVGELSVIIYML